MEFNHRPHRSPRLSFARKGKPRCSNRRGKLIFRTVLRTNTIHICKKKPALSCYNLSQIFFIKQKIEGLNPLVTHLTTKGSYRPKAQANQRALLSTLKNVFPVVTWKHLFLSLPMNWINKGNYLIKHFYNLCYSSPPQQSLFLSLMQYKKPHKLSLMRHRKDF